MVTLEKRYIFSGLTRINYVLDTSRRSVLEESVDSFYEFASCSSELILDIFLQLNIYGICALVMKSDYDGYYSPGNSLDIVILFEKIEPYIQNQETLERLDYGIRSLFHESAEKRENILIC